MDAQQEQVDRNFEAFKKLLPKILNEHRNKFALMKDGEIVGYYSTAEDARQTGERFFANQPYSIQQVTDVLIDLGFFSHAVHSR
ncbi:MAG: hypothetical protein HY423_09050 [Candidatus Lambdaproteobacteria bacterium]|nr:hypothetical protein [Candidatus Lambdaproteobacteria bacterium]